MENRIIVNIEGKAVEQIEYKGQPVLTFKMIDELHRKPDGASRNAFYRHKDKFIENEDFFDVPYEEWSEIPCVNHINAQNSRHDFIRFITESGYLMIVKPFGDDLAWRVQRALVRHYFVAKEIMQAKGETSDPELKALLKQTMNVMQTLNGTILHSFNILRDELEHVRGEREFFRDKFLTLRDNLNSKGTTRTQARPLKIQAAPSPGRQENETLDSFVSVWWKQYGDDNVGVSRLYPMIEKYELSLELGGGTERSRRIRMGRILTSMLNRQFGDYIVTAGKLFRNTKRYQLKLVPPSLMPEH